MNQNELDNVQELGDIAMLLCWQVVGLRSKAESLKTAMKEMEPFKRRIEELLTELGL